LTALVNGFLKLFTNFVKIRRELLGALGRALGRALETHKER